MRKMIRWLRQLLQGHFQNWNFVITTTISFLSLGWTIDSQHNYTEEGSLGLKYLKTPPRGFNFDLLDGYEDQPPRFPYNRSNDHRDKLSNLVTWMKEHRDKVMQSSAQVASSVFNVNVICEMGLLRSLLNLPYELGPRINAKTGEPEEQKFAASRYKGILFIKRIEVKKSEHDERPESYAGMLFEELVTEKVDTNDTCTDCFSVLKAKVGHHSLLYCCQVDCIKSKKLAPSQDDFVEIKTLPDYTLPGSQPFGRNYSKKYWQQCKVSGTREICLGVRSQEVEYVNRNKVIKNIVCNKIETLKVSKLPDYAIDWSPKEGVEMVDRFLSKVKQEVRIDSPSNVCMITIKSGKEIRFDKMRSADHQQFPVISPAMVEKLNLMTCANDGDETTTEAESRENAVKRRKFE